MPRQFLPEHSVDNVLLDILDKNRDMLVDGESIVLVGGLDRIFDDFLQGYHQTQASWIRRLLTREERRRESLHKDNESVLDSCERIWTW